MLMYKDKRVIADYNTNAKIDCKERVLHFALAKQFFDSGKVCWHCSKCSVLYYIISENKEEKGVQ